jgi:hypothetical protein
VDFDLRACYPLRTLETLMKRSDLAKEADALEACARANLGGRAAPATDAEADAFLKACKARANGSIQKDFAYRSLWRRRGSMDASTRDGG